MTETGKGLLAKLFGKKQPADRILGAAEEVAKLEAQLAAKRRETDNARQSLAQAFQNDLVGAGTLGKHPSQAAEIIELQAQVEALASLVEQARQEAMTEIAAASSGRASRITAVEEEILEVRKKIDAGYAEAVARCARALGKKAPWPGPNSGVALGISATTLTEEEWGAVVTLVEQEPIQEDPAVAKHQRLCRDLTDLQVLQRSPVDLALESLVSRFRRAA